MKKLVSILLTVALLMTCMTCLPVFAAEEGAEPVELFNKPGVTFSASTYAFDRANVWTASYGAFYKAFHSVNHLEPDNPFIEEGLDGSTWYQANLPAPCRITDVTIKTQSHKDYSTGSYLYLSKNGDFSDYTNGNTVNLGSFGVIAANTDYTITIPEEYATEKYQYIRIGKTNNGCKYGFLKISAKGYWSEPDLTVPEGTGTTDLTPLSTLITSSTDSVSLPTNLTDSNNSTTVSGSVSVNYEGGGWIALQLPTASRLSTIEVTPTTANGGFYIEAYNSKNKGTYEVLAYKPTVEKTVFEVKNTAKYDFVRIRSMLQGLTVAELKVNAYGAEPEITASCNIANEATNVSNPNLTEKVVVSFNQTMDKSTLTYNNVKLRFDAVNGGQSYIPDIVVNNDSRTVSFDMKYLKPNTRYVIILNEKNIKNINGTAMSALGEEILSTFKTGKIYVESGNQENVILKNVSLKKEVSSPNSLAEGSFDKLVDGNTGTPIRIDGDQLGNGTRQFTIDMVGSYVPKVVDITIYGAYSPQTFNGITVYGHNEIGENAVMTALGNTVGQNTYYPQNVECRIFLNNTNEYRYITIARAGTFRLYEATVWAPVVETLGTHNFDISSLDVSGDVATGFNAVTKINNFSEEETNAPKLIIAAYNGEALEAVKVSEVDTMDAKASGEITVAIPAASLAGKTITNVKTFILTNLNDITPIIKARQLNIAE